jgi:hypothetical protein
MTVLWSAFLWPLGVYDLIRHFSRSRSALSGEVYGECDYQKKSSTAKFSELELSN